MYVKFKPTFILLLTIGFLHFVNAEEREISLKPFIQPIPSIDSTYSVVHTQLYPKSNEDKFKPSVPSDFYVQKAQKQKEAPKVQTVNIQQQNIQNSQNVKQKRRQDQTKKQEIQLTLLSQNNKQPIAWITTPLKPLSSFVVENGVQHDIVQAIPEQQQALPTGQFVQEGKRPNQITPINPKETFSKPKNQQTTQNQLKSQNQPSRVPAPQQQHKANQNSHPQTQIVQLEKQRSNLIFITFGVLTLILLYAIFRSQRKTKVSSSSILHSRLENYKIEQEDEDQYSFSKSKTSLQQDEGSDDQNSGERVSIYKNSDNSLQ